MPQASKPLQDAVYLKLSGAASLSGVGVYDEVPDTANCPYIVVGECSEIPADTHNHIGRECVLTLSLFSRYSGFAEVKGLAHTVDVLLNRTALSVTGWTHIYTLFEFSQFYQDPDGKTRNGVVRYRVFLQQ